MNENYTQDFTNGTQIPAQNGEYRTIEPNNYNGPIVVANAIPSKNGGLAVGSLVCGIIGIVSFWSVAPSLIISIVGIILGIVNIAKKNPQKGMAIGGIITSVLGLLLSIAMIVILIAAAALVDSGYAM